MYLKYNIKKHKYSNLKYLIVKHQNYSNLKYVIVEQLTGGSDFMPIPNEYLTYAYELLSDTENFDGIFLYINESEILGPFKEHNNIYIFKEWFNDLIWILLTFHIENISYNCIFYHNTSSDSNANEYKLLCYKVSNTDIWFSMESKIKNLQFSINIKENKIVKLESDFSKILQQYTIQNSTTKLFCITANAIDWKSVIDESNEKLIESSDDIDWNKIRSELDKELKESTHLLTTSRKFYFPIDEYTIGYGYIPVTPKVANAKGFITNSEEEHNSKIKNIIEQLQQQGDLPITEDTWIGKLQEEHGVYINTYIKK